MIVHHSFSFLRQNGKIWTIPHNLKRYFKSDFQLFVAHAKTRARNSHVHARTPTDFFLPCRGFIFTPFIHYQHLNFFFNEIKPKLEENFWRHGPNNTSKIDYFRQKLINSSFTVKLIMTMWRNKYSHSKAIPPSEHNPSRINLCHLRIKVFSVFSAQIRYHPSRQYVTKWFTCKKKNPEIHWRIGQTFYFPVLSNLAHLWSNSYPLILFLFDIFWTPFRCVFPTIANILYGKSLYWRWLFWGTMLAGPEKAVRPRIRKLFVIVGGVEHLQSHFHHLSAILFLVCIADVSLQSPGNEVGFLPISSRRGLEEGRSNAPQSFPC